MTELAALLKLCDDPSPLIAAKIALRLREVAEGAPEADIWALIVAQGLEVLPSQRAALEAIFAASPDDAATDAQGREAKLRSCWAGLRFEDDEATLLETALLALCDWQNGAGSGARGRELLDEIALEFGDFEPPTGLENSGGEAAALAYFLFEWKNLRGAAPEDYYHPQQSNLTATLETGMGLPITLACIFILVGRRVGLSIHGCSFPGHFLARDGQTRRIFDPFNGGRALSAREVGALKRAAPEEMNEAAPAREIVARVLRNLSVAYYQSGESEKSALMLSLLPLMED